jgi:hypothetical protein
MALQINNYLHEETIVEKAYLTINKIDVICELMESFTVDEKEHLHTNYVKKNVMRVSFKIYNDEETYKRNARPLTTTTIFSDYEESVNIFKKGYQTLKYVFTQYELEDK